MVSGEFWDAAWSWTVPAYGTGLAFLVWLYRATPAIMARLNERARDKEAAKASDWTRLRELRDEMHQEISRLSERVEVLEEKVAACEDERDDWKSRAITAEAALMGQGEARQRAQRIVSEERENMKKSGQ